MIKKFKLKIVEFKHRGAEKLFIEKKSCADIIVFVLK